MSAKNISASIVAQILTALTNDGPLPDNEVNALIDRYLQVETPVTGPLSDVASSPGLIEAWLAASPADRLALLNSDPAGFVNGAWQFMDADDRAHFLRECASSLPDDNSHHRLLTPSDCQSKVVQLFHAPEEEASADREHA